VIRLALADDHPLVLDALEQLFRLEGDFQVVARCTRGDEVLTAVRKNHPDVLVLDFLMAGGDGITVLRQLRSEPDSPRTVLLSAVISESEMLEAIRLGARGVLLKDMAPRQIVECVRKVHAGGEWLDRDLLSRATRSLLRRTDDVREALQRLTARELEIVRSVAAGLRNQEIANRLKISVGTVKIHLHNIYDKLDVDGRVALAVWAKDRGLA
jgi:two-component system, NarL family, nitrate/nitrite response regulator NarL